MTRAPLIALLTACLAVQAIPAPTPTPTPMSYLEHAQFFAIGPISDDARMSDGERSLRAVLSEQDATQKLHQLLQSASPEGQLYALIGLRVRDRAAFDRALSAFARRDDVVHTMVGCIGRDESMRLVAERIAQGDYDKDIQRAPY